MTVITVSGDRQRGGHLLAVEVSSGKVLLQEVRGLLWPGRCWLHDPGGMIL
jgi:hypothetical protein